MNSILTKLKQMLFSSTQTTKTNIVCFDELQSSNRLQHPVENSISEGLPKVKPEQLDHVIHALHCSGELSQLTKQQVDSIIYAFQSVGHLDPPSEYLPKVKPEQLDHVIHALHCSGELAQLTVQQVNNILHAFRVTGHTPHIVDVTNAAYNDGSLITFHRYSADFLKNPIFNQAYQLGEDTNSWPEFDIRWRIYVICWAATHAKNLAGDYVECGVNRGGYSRALVHYTNFESMSDRTLYLCDTFCGIPIEDKNSEFGFYFDPYSECYDDVCATFKSYENVKIIKGILPQTLNQIASENICYLSIDLDNTKSEIATAEFFWEKMVSGGVIILDDYGVGEYDVYKEQKAAFDEFAKRKGVEVFSLPTRQGLIFKPNSRAI